MFRGCGTSNAYATGAKRFLALIVALWQGRTCRAGMDRGGSQRDDHDGNGLGADTCDSPQFVIGTNFAREWPCRFIHE